MAKRGESECKKWLIDRLDYGSDDCLVWPYSKARGGYGQFVCDRKMHYAHRFVCELKHGPAPSPTHEAAHGCGNSSCVNPRHISWKTRFENKMDCRLHGTHIKHRYGNMGKVTRDQAAQIRALEGIKTLKEIGEQFGLSESGVSNIWRGRNHARPSKINHWSAEEDDKLRDCIRRGLSFTEMGNEIGRTVNAIMGHAYRIGLTSGREPSRPSYQAARAARITVSVSDVTKPSE